MSKIESLTPEQESQLSVYRDKWFTIGLATGPVDFEKAKEAEKKDKALRKHREHNHSEDQANVDLQYRCARLSPLRAPPARPDAHAVWS